VNGSAGFIYNTASQVFEAITDNGYPGAMDALFMDGYFVQIEPARRFAFNSELADGLAYNTLDRFTSEKSPDLLMALGATQNDLILFSEGSGEFFENTGAAQQPFRSKRISMERGCASRYGVVHLDNTVFWLGDDGKFYVLDGYGPRRISTRPIEQSILGLNWAQAFGFVWESAGHACAYWTFPDGQTWGYDVSQPPGFQWHRRESYGFDRWRVTSTAYWKNRWIAGDFQSGRLWELDWDYPLEFETEMVSELTSPVIHDNQSAVLMPRLEFMFDTGQPEVAVREFEIDVEPLDIDGNLPDGFVGDSGTYQYTVSGGVPPLVGVSLFSGTLPPGATMNSAGLVTYTFTTSGSYSWVVQVTDADGNTATVADSAEVLAVPIFVAIDNITTLRTSTDGGATFPSTVTSGLTTPASEVCVMAAGGKLFHLGTSNQGRVSSDGAAFSACTGLPFAAGTSNLIHINSEYQWYGGDLYVSSDGATFAQRVISSGMLNLAYRPAVMGSTVLCRGAGNRLNVSTNSGTTFTEYQLADYNTFEGFQRVLAVETFRFLIFGRDAATGNLRIGRSTTGLPGSWTSAAGPATAVVHGVAFDPAAYRIVIVLQTGATWYSDDEGATWNAGAAVPYAGALAYPSEPTNNMIFSGGYFYFCAAQGSGVNRIYRTPNGVNAWAQVYEASPTGNSIDSMCEFAP
jgi:hypothetical protein